MMPQRLDHPPQRPGGVEVGNDRGDAVLPRLEPAPALEPDQRVASAERGDQVPAVRALGGHDVHVLRKVVALVNLRNSPGPEVLQVFVQCSLASVTTAVALLAGHSLDTDVEPLAREDVLGPPEPLPQVNINKRAPLTAALDEDGKGLGRKPVCARLACVRFDQRR